MSQTAPQKSSIERAVQIAKEKLSRHVQYSTAVYEAARQVGIDPAILYREMSERSAKRRHKLAQTKRRPKTWRAELTAALDGWMSERGAA